jgi:hypothetical protein
VERYRPQFAYGGSGRRCDCVGGVGGRHVFAGVRLGAGDGVIGGVSTARGAGAIRLPGVLREPVPSIGVRPAPHAIDRMTEGR